MCLPWIWSGGNNPCKSETVVVSVWFPERTQPEEVTGSQPLLPFHLSPHCRTAACVQWQKGLN
ncbi:rCG28910 [Rattus norvegicus]|uniref:RCG28910 n=1 Tax=Rattus norvegicus TaxID=10116 RepID=A6HWH9_RAT|nr:rCG28910 [Rattus norvegicus]